jgi:hypothetical protein
MGVRFCPPPDLTRLIDNILQLDTNSKCPALDDKQINAFSRDKYCYALHSKRLYNILKKEIQLLTDNKRRDLRKWTNKDISVTNIDALPEFVEFAHEVGKHAVEQDRILRFVKHNYDKYLKGGDDVNPSPKVNGQLIYLFRKEFDDNMKAFWFTLNDDGVLTPFPIHSFILFAIQIRSLFNTVSQLPQGELLNSLARIFTGCIPHREENDHYREYTAGQLPHNHIFFELVVVACGSMIDIFCQLGYLIISEHKTGAMEIQVHDNYKDVDGLMIIPTQDVLVEIFHPDSTTIHPDLAVSENTIAVTLFQPLLQPPSKRTRPKTKPPPVIGLPKTESTLQSKRSKRQKTNEKPVYQDKDDDEEEDEDDNKEYDEGEREDNHPGINSDKSKWSSRYKDTSFWPDKGGYNLEEWEFKEK